MKVRFRSLSPTVTCAALLLVGAHTARAAGVVGTGTAASCTDAALNTALAAGGLVTFNCGGPATIDISTGTGTKRITADTTIDGGGVTAISGGHTARVFEVRNEFNGTLNGPRFTVENLTIADGLGGFIADFVSGGGGIANFGSTVVVTNCTFTGNSGGNGPPNGNNWGGGIYNGGGVLTVTRSTFSGNRGGNGGAINGPATVTNSTFYQNRAGIGGGIYGGTLITNSTFTGNSADNGDSSGGGIAAEGGVSITNSTFTANSGGGILAQGVVVLRNTIVAGDNGCVNYNGTTTDGGHNIDDSGTCGFSTANGSLSNTNPQLDPAGLHSNGGPTQTVALCTAVGLPAGCTAASPAIDAGDQDICAAVPVNDRDQRGFLRPGFGHTQCSIGAYEADATPSEACIGDCDARGTVTVDELITLVNIALGNQGSCANGVPAGATVDVTLIITAVNNALSGCPSSDLYVAASGSLNGDGSAANPYRRITDAVVRARAERGAIPTEEEIRIHVAAGTYVGSFDATQLQNNPDYEVLPIILNVPRLAVLGATVLVRDDRGLPTGAATQSETILQPDRSLGQNQNLFLVTRTADGAVGNGVTVDGFVLDGREGPYPELPVFVDRVSDFRISNNLIQHGSFGVTTRLASGTIEGNLLTHNDEAGAVATGGSIAQPATVFIHANRVAGNGQHGIMTLAQATLYLMDRGTNTLALQPLQTTFDRNNPQDVQNIPDTVAVTVSGNDINDYGVFGIRLLAVIPEPPIADCSGPLSYQTQDATQPLTAVLTANVLGNTFAGSGIWSVGMEAGFPCRNDPRPLLVTFGGSFEQNSFVGRPALFTFTEWSGANLDYGFARESTYQVTDADGELTRFDYDNPIMDPFTGTVLNNTLTVNGVEIPHGKHHY